MKPVSHRVQLQNIETTCKEGLKMKLDKQISEVRKSI